MTDADGYPAGNDLFRIVEEVLADERARSDAEDSGRREFQIGRVLDARYREIATRAAATIDACVAVAEIYSLEDTPELRTLFAELIYRWVVDCGMPETKSLATWRKEIIAINKAAASLRKRMQGCFDGLRTGTLHPLYGTRLPFDRIEEDLRVLEAFTLEDAKWFSQLSSSKYDKQDRPPFQNMISRIAEFLNRSKTRYMRRNRYTTTDGDVYRPSKWGKFALEIVLTITTVTLPEEFLDSAAYRRRAQGKSKRG